MDSFCETEDSYDREGKELHETTGSLFGVKMAELQKLKEKLGKAKDDAVQSWLDSRPLIDELEKLQSELASAKSRTTITSTTTSDLEAQLDTVSRDIRSKRQEELKARRMISKKNQDIEKKQEEMEVLKIERDEKHRARLQLKQVLRLRKQTLGALQLTVRATRMESEAYGASAAEADNYINQSQMDDHLVNLTQEDYRALIRRAKEETSLAEWRISVYIEQKHVAEESRNSTARRLLGLSSKNGSREKETQSIGLGNQPHAPQAEDLHSKVMAGAYAINGQSPFQKTQSKSPSQANQKKSGVQQKRSKGKKKYLPKKKKKSIFAWMRAFLVQKIIVYCR